MHVEKKEGHGASMLWPIGRQNLEENETPMLKKGMHAYSYTLLLAETSLPHKNNKDSKTCASNKQK